MIDFDLDNEIEGREERQRLQEYIFTVATEHIGFKVTPVDAAYRPLVTRQLVNGTVTYVGGDPLPDEKIKSYIDLLKLKGCQRHFHKHLLSELETAEKELEEHVKESVIKLTEPEMSYVGQFEGTRWSTEVEGNWYNPQGTGIFKDLSSHTTKLPKRITDRAIEETRTSLSPKQFWDARGIGYAMRPFIEKGLEDLGKDIDD